jgi:GTP-binding protein
VFEAIEKFSVVKTLQAIADANVVLLLIDATQGVSDQDAHIAGYILEAAARWWWPSTSGTRSTSYQRQTAAALDRERLAFLKFAPVLHISAIKRQGLGRCGRRSPRRTCLGHHQDAHAGADAAAARGGAAPGAKRAACLPPQAALRPPGRHEPAGGGDPRQFAGARHRQLQALPGRALREHFKLVGTPLRIEMRLRRNPFDEKAD